MNDLQKCEICSTDARYWANIKGYTHFKCAHCGHLFAYPRPTQNELDDFYQKGAYYDAAELQRDRLVREAGQRICLLERMAAKYQLGKRLLDVGCASGYFLSAARQAGWDAWGLERSSEMAHHARKQSGATVIEGVLEDVEIAGAPFEVITAWEVVEHTIDPRDFFGTLAKHVAPGGLLAFSTPLGTGIPAKLLGVHYPMLTPPEHLSIFSRKSLRMLAQEFGFEEIHFISFSNLSMRSIASGICQRVFGCNLHSVGLAMKIPAYILAISASWVPSLMDVTGWGTEMQVIFRRQNL